MANQVSQMQGWTRGKVAVGRLLALRHANSGEFDVRGVIDATERGQRGLRIATLRSGERIGYSPSSPVWTRESEAAK